MHAVYRAIDFRALDSWLQQTRARRGLVLVDKFGIARELPRLLERGAPVGFVADQNGGDRGLFVPFFDRLASSYKSIGLAAIRANAPIICGQARRLVWERDSAGEADADLIERGHNLGFAEWSGEPFRYRVDVVDLISPEEWEKQPDPLFYVTARYRRAIETMVRRAPEQYLWMHRYWKSRPRHERLGRPMPSQLREKIEQLPWTTPESLARVEEWSRRDTRALAEGKAQSTGSLDPVGMPAE
jgi:KDO2-lipid IV(A) lauroyltransferase